MHVHSADIVSTIKEWLGEHKALCESVKRFAQTSLGGYSSYELNVLLASDDNERDLFLELLVYPDKELQTRIEPYVEVPLAQQDCAWIKQQLQRESIHGFVWASDSTLVQHAVPSWLIDDLVDRLRLEVPIPAVIRDAANACDDAAPVYVQLRNSRLLGSADGSELFEIQCDLISRFLRGMPCSTPEFDKYFELWLVFLDSMKAEEDPWMQLVERRRVLSQALHGVYEFAEKLKRFNMETLMLQGQTVPFVDEETTKQDIRRIDRISLAVFAKPAAVGDEVHEVFHSGIDPNENLDGVLQILSKLDD